MKRKRKTASYIRVMCAAKNKKEEKCDVLKEIHLKFMVCGFLYSMFTFMKALYQNRRTYI